MTPLSKEDLEGMERAGFVRHESRKEDFDALLEIARRGLAVVEEHRCIYWQRKGETCEDRGEDLCELCKLRECFKFEGSSDV